MADNVKFIFKTLIKVPVIIAVSFFVFNLFAFCFIYFKLLGASYVVMQTAAENNYLPPNELKTLYNYVDSFNDLVMVQNATIVISKDSSGEYLGMTSVNDTVDSGNADDARKKRQYGREVTVGVSADYIFVWPLQPEKVDGLNKESAGQDGQAVYGDDSIDLNGEYENAVLTGNNITIAYTIPGLHYYPDMLTR